MACPLSAILISTDESSRATGSSRNSSTVDASSRTSTGINADDPPDLNTPAKHRRSSPNIHSSGDKSTASGTSNSVVVSSAGGILCQRRASSSPSSVPAPRSTSRRELSTYLSCETKINRFAVFNALLGYPELVLEVTKHLDVDDLISLYAISKDFHVLVNARFTAMIQAQAIGKASESSRTFIFRCYKNLCMRDPARRLNETHPEQLRFIPTFRWLRMILFRESVVDEIIECLAAEGHRLPKRTSQVIKKIWFTIDISDNARRVGLMHNQKFWANKDLFLATMFFVKLDMRLTDPTTGNGELGLRKMLLGQRSLSTLARVLRREEMRTQLDMLRMILRWNYRPATTMGMTILGVPPEEVGKLQYEGWGHKKTKFIHIDELVMGEAIRRNLNLHHHYVDMMIYGYVDKRTFEDIRTPMPPPRPQIVEPDSEEDGEVGIVKSDTEAKQGRCREDMMPSDEINSTGRP